MTIQEKIQALLDQREAEVNTYKDYEFDISVIDDEVRIKISKMYSLDGFVTFEFLDRLSALLGTKNINLEDQEFFRGCDSCDYGSSDNVTIVARECTYGGQQ